MSVGGPQMFKFMGQYLKLFDVLEEVDTNQQMINIDWWRNEGTRYFDTHVMKLNLGNEKAKPAEVDKQPIHPAQVAITTVAANFQNSTFIIMKHSSKEKDPKKFSHNFFTPWLTAMEVSKLAKINSTMLLDAIGQHYTKKKEPIRADWVELFNELNFRFTNFTPFLLKTDFERMADIVGIEISPKVFYEEVFARFMGHLYRKLQALQQVMQCVVHMSNTRG